MLSSLKKKELLCRAVLILTTTIFKNVYGQTNCGDFFSPKTLLIDGSSSGTLVFPEMGPAYLPNQYCEWQIVSSTPGTVIKFEVMWSKLQGRDIHDDCSTDYVDIFDWKNNDIIFLNRFCGSESGQSYESTGQKMTVRFISNYIMQFSGFSATYQALEEKGNDLDSHTTLLLAVCLPVGVILLILAIPFTFKMVKMYRKKAEDARVAHLLQMAQFAASIRNSDGSVFPQVRQEDTSDGYTLYCLQLGIAPPPSYYSLEPNHVGSQPPLYDDEAGLQPPPYRNREEPELPSYEQAIKQSEPKSNSVDV